MDNIIKVTGQQQERIKLPMCGKDREGNLYEVDNLSLLKNGKRFFPVMGEFHYSRYEACGLGRRDPENEGRRYPHCRCICFLDPS